MIFPYILILKNIKSSSLSKMCLITWTFKGGDSWSNGGSGYNPGGDSWSNGGSGYNPGGDSWSNGGSGYNPGIILQWNLIVKLSFKNSYKFLIKLMKSQCNSKLIFFLLISSSVKPWSYLIKSKHAPIRAKISICLFFLVAL